MIKLCSITDGPRHPDEDAEYVDEAIERLETLHRIRHLKDSSDPVIREAYYAFCNALAGKPVLQRKVGEYSGDVLYSYDCAYWFSSPESAWTAWQILNPNRGNTDDR